jgi:hypothetical protein
MQRIDAYKNAYMKWPASWPHFVYEQDRDVLYATWIIGNDYRNASTLYGAYPRGYVERIMALFPDKQQILHVFSGSVPAGPYTRLDLVNRTDNDMGFLQGDVYQVGHLFPNFHQFDLILADPPYTPADALKYKTPMVNRVRAMSALSDIMVIGGHLVWLDTVWPMHSKTQWVTVGRITVIRSTAHRVRVAHIFERR